MSGWNTVRVVLDVAGLDLRDESYSQPVETGTTAVATKHTTYLRLCIYGPGGRGFRGWISEDFDGRVQLHPVSGRPLVCPFPRDNPDALAGWIVGALDATQPGSRYV